MLSVGTRIKFIILSKACQIQKDKYHIWWQDEKELTESGKQEEKQQDRGEGEKVMEGGGS